MMENNDKRSEYANVSEVWAKNEKKNGNKTRRTTRGKKGEKETPKKDYWERVADDVASGYEKKEDENSVLNEDQAPGDNEPAGKESE